MPKYTFTFKKDDIFVEFSTEDKDVVERQFQIWVCDADDYVNNRPRRTYEPLPSSAPIEIEDPVDEPIAVTVVDEKIEQQSVNEPQINENSEQIVNNEVQMEEEEKSQASINLDAQPSDRPSTIEEQPEVFDKASSLLRTINSIQEEEEVKPEEPEVPPVAFEDVLEKTIENPTFEPDKSKDQVFLNLITSKKTADKFHYLMITAFYLSEFEKFERFSLKQINAKLMQNLSEVIDHATLQDAINQNLMELVPDLTGVAEVAEYRLTPSGEEFFAKI